MHSNGPSGRRASGQAGINSGASRAALANPTREHNDGSDDDTVIGAGQKTPRRVVVSATSDNFGEGVAALVEVAGEQEGYASADAGADTDRSQGLHAPHSRTPLPISTRAPRASTGGIDQDGEIVGALRERIEWATPELTAEGFDRCEHIHGVLRMIGARP